MPRGDSEDDPDILLTPDECVICLETLGHGDGRSLTTLPCRHSFHAACIGRWEARPAARGTSPRCPVCRRRYGAPDAGIGPEGPEAVRVHVGDDPGADEREEVWRAWMWRLDVVVVVSMSALLYAVVAGTYAVLSRL